MKKKWILLVMIGLVVAVSGTLAVRQLGKDRPAKSSAPKMLYTCGMHPQIVSDKPGDCPICHMELTPMRRQANAGTGERKVAYYRDSAKPWITSDTPGTGSNGMEMEPVYEGDPADSAVRIDPRTVQNIGVTTEPAGVRKMTKTVRTSGTVSFDETKVASVNSKIMGWIEKLHATYTGQQVKKGQPLYQLYSPDLVSAQQEYLLAYRSRTALGEAATPESQTAAAELLQSAHRKLLNWDISEGEIRALESRGTPAKAVTFYAPSSGFITEKMVVEGQNVMPGMELFRIVDLSEIWVMSDIYQEDLAFVKVGQHAMIEISFLPGQTEEGRISYISPILDPNSKTVQVRIALANRHGFNLKPGMFATVAIHSPVVFEAVAIPEQSVIRSGKRNVVIVSIGNGRFEPREVQLGITAENYVQVLEGIHEGEKIVTSSQFLIDSESNLKQAVKGMMEQPGAPEDGETPTPEREMPQMPGHQH